LEDFTKEDEEQRAAMHAAVGKAILSWASTEMQLNLLFIGLLGFHQKDTANGIWGELKSFDARMSILEHLLELHTLLDPDVKNDAVLLMRYTRTCGKRRNQIAHSTLIYEGTSGARLQPFYVFGTKTERLTAEDVLVRADEFIELTNALGWLQITRMRPATAPPPESTLPASWTRLPDLMTELRERQSQSRKAQQVQQRDMRLVAQLRKAGKWPPPEA
jgi:hypothetical protein